MKYISINLVFFLVFCSCNHFNKKTEKRLLNEKKRWNDSLIMFNNAWSDIHFDSAMGVQKKDSLNFYKQKIISADRRLNEIYDSLLEVTGVEYRTK